MIMINGCRLKIKIVNLHFIGNCNYHNFIITIISKFLSKVGIPPSVGKQWISLFIKPPKTLFLFIIITLLINGEILCYRKDALIINYLFEEDYLIAYVFFLFRDYEKRGFLPKQRFHKGPRLSNQLELT